MVAHGPSSQGASVFVVRGDGKRLFSSQRNADAQTQQPYFTSAEGDGTKWTPLPSPKMAHGAVRLNYDADHHVMYSANTTSGCGASSRSDLRTRRAPES